MTTDRLFQMARMASKNTNLIASLIYIYSVSENVDWSQVASMNNMTTDQLARLALCRRPRDENRLEDIRETANYVGVEVNLLGRFIIRMENMVELQSISDDHLLMAARDRDKDEDSQ